MSRLSRAPRLRLYCDPVSADRLCKLASFYRADFAAIVRLALADLWQRVEPVFDADRPEVTGDARAEQRRRIQPYREVPVARSGDARLNAIASEILKTSAADYADLRRGLWRPRIATPTAKKQRSA